MKIYTLRNAKVLGHTTDTEPHALMQVEAEEISDGYHTIDELYDHRRVLTVALFRQLSVIYKLYGNVKVFKAKKHYDGTMFDGYFIVVACFDNGKNQISYHYDIKYWDDFNIESLDKVPFKYDGHTSQDVIERLLKL